MPGSLLRLGWSVVQDEQLAPARLAVASWLASRRTAPPAEELDLDRLWPARIPPRPRPQSAAEPSLPMPRPLPLSCPPPVYPAESVKRGEEGNVHVRIEIAASGKVKSVRVLESSGSATLDACARATVAAWRFAPMTNGRSSVRVTLDHRLTFKLVSKRG